MGDTVVEAMESVAVEETVEAALDHSSVLHSIVVAVSTGSGMVWCFRFLCSCELNYSVVSNIYSMVGVGVCVSVAVNVISCYE